MPDTIMPTDLPRIDGPQAWTGREQVARGDWSYTLSADDVAEIDSALAGVRDIEILDIDKSAFPLPASSISSRHRPYFSEKTFPISVCPASVGCEGSSSKWGCHRPSSVPSRPATRKSTNSSRTFPGDADDDAAACT